eukprot:1374409-Amorphochlora_amoeboformis.AAC.3
MNHWGFGGREREAGGWITGIDSETGSFCLRPLEPIPEARLYLGKNDGMVKGVRYFQARPKFGAFLKPDAIKS